MKHHAYALAIATQWKRPPRLNVRQRKRCIHPPPDGREVEPPAPPPDFATVIQGAQLSATWRIGFPEGIVNVAKAFEAM